MLSGNSSFANRNRSNSTRSNGNAEDRSPLENKSMALYEESLPKSHSTENVNGGEVSIRNLSSKSYHHSSGQNDENGSSPSSPLITGDRTSVNDASGSEDEGLAQLSQKTTNGTKKQGKKNGNHNNLGGGNNDKGKKPPAVLPFSPPAVPVKGLTAGPLAAPPGVLGTVLGHQAAGPHAVKLVATFIAGFVLLSLATLGLRIWHTANWFHDPGPFAGNLWPGYNLSHYVGLLMFTLFSTSGFTLFYVPLTIAGRYRSSQLALVVLAAFAALCMVVGIIGIATWGHPMMHCLGFFCVGPEGSWSHEKHSRPSSGFGFLVVIGTSACFSLCPISLVLFLQFYDRLFSPLRHATPSFLVSKLRGMHQMSQPKNKSRLLVTFLVLVFLVTSFIATTFIPNSWEYFTASQVASNARKQQTMNFDDCNSNYAKYSCGELPGASFPTKNYRVNPNLLLKFYPANVFFYGYLISVLLFIVGCRTVKPGRLFLKTQVKFVRRVISITYGELIVSTATLLMVFLFSWYWFHDHNFNGSYAGPGQQVGIGIKPSEQYARAFGQLAVVLLSLLLFPASRNSVLHRLFGTSWEASLWAHKALGWGMIAATIAHVVSWYIKYHQKGIFPAAIWSIPTALPESIDNFTVPIISVAVLVLLITTIFLTFSPIRRGFFEVFYYPHLFAAYLIIPTALWHAASGWEYMLPGVTVWFMDRVIRMYRSGSEVIVTEVLLHEDTTEIRFQCPRMKVKAGQYVFLNIPELSLFEWHPFTLSSGVGSPHFSCHIKAMYDGSWTARLLQRMEQTAKKNIANTSMTTKDGVRDEASATSNHHRSSSAAVSMERVITLAVDGPYGHAYDFEDYDRVVLVAGGIGVTPIASVYKTLQLEAPGVEVLALWSTRKLSSIDAFRDQLEAPAVDPTKSIGKPKKVKVFVTKSTTDEERLEANEKQKTLRSVEIYSGRPELLGECCQDTTLPTESCSTLLFVCGPSPLVQDAKEVAHELGYHFHAETFFL